MSAIPGLHSAAAVGASTGSAADTAAIPDHTRSHSSSSPPSTTQPAFPTSTPPGCYTGDFKVSMNVYCFNERLRYKTDPTTP